MEALREERDSLLQRIQPPPPRPEWTEAQQEALDTRSIPGDCPLLAQWTAPELRQPPCAAYPAPPVVSNPPHPREVARRQQSPRTLGVMRQATYPSYEPPIVNAAAPRSTLDATLPVAAVAAGTIIASATSSALPVSGRSPSPLGTHSERGGQQVQALATAPVAAAPLHLHSATVLRQQSSRLASPVRRRPEPQVPMAPHGPMHEPAVGSARAAASTPPRTRVQVLAAPASAITARGLTSRVHVHGPPGAPLSAAPPQWLQADLAAAAQGRRSPSPSPERQPSLAPQPCYVLVADGASRPGCWSPPHMVPPGHLPGGGAARGSPARQSPVHPGSPPFGGASVAGMSGLLQGPVARQR